MTLSFVATARRGSFVLDVSLQVGRGEVVAVVGPNGSGKSTLLRGIAGLVPLSSGATQVGSRVLESVTAGIYLGPQDRQIAFVFQDNRLFPHMSVAQNIAYGPRSRGAGRRDATATAERWMERLGISEFADRKPRTLSGGQAQRVAIARAMATDPAAILLDEPLAAVDVTGKAELRTVIAEQLRALGIPAILVTHSAVDAMLIARRIVVLQDGRVVQDAESAEIATRPANPFVAALMGVNLYPATVDDNGMLSLGNGWTLTTVSQSRIGTDVMVVLRPSTISVYSDLPVHPSARNVWPATVTGVEPIGDRVRLATSAPDHLGDALVDVTAAAVAELELWPGRRVWLSVKATEVATFTR